MWNKSEYAWEADAWSDVFGKIRDEPLLVMDKHEYNANLPDNDPQTCLLTGQRKFVRRIPDATFGLSTYRPQTTTRVRKQPINSLALHQDRLERLALHPRCGLISDPKWGEANLVFPWAVYEAKGWNGDYREARRQACSAGARFLHILDHLARVPGLSGAERIYQTPSSHEFQVFALTSFGAHWHVLVGFMHDRLPEQEAGTDGMSKRVATFERIWSGRINTERGAWELLVLIDAIQEYALSTFRDFVIRHLDAWHDHCDDSYLHETLLAQQTDRKGKRKRDDANEENVPHVPLPHWCEFVDGPTKDKMREKAKECLRAAATEQYEVEQSFDKKYWTAVGDQL
ncbi:MAG: hypothetical protein M1832_006418 [Thelocarpon impressellum]|nr:MAG: hypothetical protein M1832_006418 [Thelocarpon impressellum]